MEISSKEFYLTPTGEIMVHDNSGTYLLSEENREFISSFIEKMNIFYPEAFNALSNLYSKSRANVPHFEFLIVKRFLKCNFGRYDNTMDIDNMGNFHFEEVECPLRGECSVEGVVCKPKYNSKLSERELSVMKLLYEGKSFEEISSILFISTETARTHKRNVLQKTGTHSVQDFFIYARNNNLFIK